MCLQIFVKLFKKIDVVSIIVKYSIAIISPIENMIIVILYYWYSCFIHFYIIQNLSGIKNLTGLYWLLKQNLRKLINITKRIIKRYGRNTDYIRLAPVTNHTVLV